MRTAGMRLVACALVVAFAASACSSSSGATQQTCTDAKALETSVDNLRSLNITQAGTDGLKQAVTQVETDAKALGSSAQKVLGPPVQDLKAAVQTLADTVGNLSGSSLGSALTEIGSEIQAVGTAATDLQDSITNTC